jgi:hypothetical protein
MNWMHDEENWALMLGLLIAVAPFLWMLWAVVK